MTSKNLFWAKWMENVRRRGWTFALCFVGLFIQMPVVTWIELSSEKSYLNSLIAQGAQGGALIDASRMRMQSLVARAADSEPGIPSWPAVSPCCSPFRVLFPLQQEENGSVHERAGIGSQTLCARMGDGIFAFAVCYLANLTAVLVRGLFVRGDDGRRAWPSP